MNEVFCPCIHLWVSCGIGENPLYHQWCFLDHFYELTWHLSSLLEMENCDQGLGEYVRVLLQWSINHLSLYIIHLVLPHFFHILILCIYKVIVFMGMFHMVNMVIGVIKLERVKFWMTASNCCVRRAYILDVSLFLLKYFGIGPCL